MIQDWFNSIKGHFNQKTTNPFFGTLLMVWVYKNWILIYAIFNFDDSYTLERKINFISTHLNYNIFLDIGITFLILSFSYILINISRLIVNFFEKIITPYIYKLTDKTSIVFRIDLENQMKLNSNLIEKFEQERKAKMDAQNEIEKLENDISELKRNIHLKSVFESNETDFNEIIENIKKEGYLSEIEPIIDRIDNNMDFEALIASLKYLVRIELIRRVNTNNPKLFRFTFTPLGKRFRDYYINNFIIKKSEDKSPETNL